MIRAVVALMLLLQGTAPTTSRPGVVLGTLQTPGGGPAASIRISAVAAPPPTIRPSDGQNYYSGVAPASTALSDANGRYRLANLAPGRYFIVAQVFGYSTFYPDTTDPDRATVVTIGAAGPVEGVDFTVQLPPGGRVSGRVDRPEANAREKAILSGIALADL